jgi:hypothetical protein
MILINPILMRFEAGQLLWLAQNVYILFMPIMHYRNFQTHMFTVFPLLVIVQFMKEMPHWSVGQL